MFQDFEIRLPGIAAAALASAKQANYTYVRDEGFVYAHKGRHARAAG